MRVAVGTPHGGNVRPEFYRRIMEVQNGVPHIEFVHIEIDLMIIGKARNIIVQDFLAHSGADVLWFIDDDVYVPPNSGVLLEQAEQYGIVSGLYFNRHNPYTPQCYTLSPIPEERGMYESIIDYPSQGLVHSDAVGGGCLAIRRDVLVTMEKLYRERTEQALERTRAALREGDEGALNEFEWLTRYARRLSPWFEFLDEKGEDFYFCERAKEAGFSIWTNVEVKCEHVGDVAISEGHFKFLVEQGMLVRLDVDGQPIDDPRYPQPQTVAVETEGEEVPSEDSSDSPSGT